MSSLSYYCFELAVPTRRIKSVGIVNIVFAGEVVNNHLSSKYRLTETMVSNNHFCAGFYQQKKFWFFLNSLNVFFIRKKWKCRRRNIFHYGKGPSLKLCLLRCDAIILEQFLWICCLEQLLNGIKGWRQQHFEPNR